MNVNRSDSQSFRFEAVLPVDANVLLNHLANRGVQAPEAVVELMTQYATGSLSNDAVLLNWRTDIPMQSGVAIDLFLKNP